MPIVQEPTDAEKSAVWLERTFKGQASEAVMETIQQPGSDLSFAARLVQSQLGPHAISMCKIYTFGIQVAV